LGNLLVSMGLIALTFILFKENIEVEKKLLYGICGYLAIAILCIIFNVNIIIYLICAAVVALWLKHKADFNTREIKWYLAAICILTFAYINMWGLIGAAILNIHFGYGFFKSLYKGFMEMNSTFDFIVGLTNELIMELGIENLPTRLITISDKTRKNFETWDMIQTIFELLDYL